MSHDDEGLLFRAELEAAEYQIERAQEERDKTVIRIWEDYNEVPVKYQMGNGDDVDYVVFIPKGMDPGGWLVLCMVEAKVSPNVDQYEHEDGKILIFCHA